MYALARSSTGRPTLQHRTDDMINTYCGLDMRNWSRAYQPVAIREILCKKCGKV